MDENGKKFLIFVLVIMGILIFYGVIMLRVDVLAREADAKMHKISADMEWHGYLLQKAMAYSQAPQEATPEQ